MGAMGTLLDRVRPNQSRCGVLGRLTFFFLPLGRLAASLELFSRWLAWTCDAIDFFSVTLTVPLLQKEFNKKDPSEIVRTPNPLPTI